MENNRTKILSQAENQQSMKKTSSLVSRVSETPENIKPIENPQLEKGQVSELENFKETSSISENQQHLTKNFQCSLLFPKENRRLNSACLFETRQENTVENISENFQNMENLTEKNEEKSALTVPQIDKKS